MDITERISKCSWVDNPSEQLRELLGIGLELPIAIRFLEQCAAVLRTNGNVPGGGVRYGWVRDGAATSCECGGGSYVGRSSTHPGQEHVVDGEGEGVGGRSLLRGTHSLVSAEQHIHGEGLAVPCTDESVPEWRRKSGGAHGPNVERNRRKRAERKARKQRNQERGIDTRRGYFSDCESEVRRQLAETRAALFIARNAEQAESARRRLAVMQSIDVDLEKKLRSAKLVASTESSLVSIENSHAKLAATGNVIGETYCSISPDSSASTAELRRLQKNLIDLQADNDRLRTEKGEPLVDHEKACNGTSELDELENRYANHDAEIWTMDTEQRRYFDLRGEDYTAMPLHEMGMNKFVVRIF